MKDISRERSLQVSCQECTLNAQSGMLSLLRVQKTQRAASGALVFTNWERGYCSWAGPLGREPPPTAGRPRFVNRELCLLEVRLVRGSGDAAYATL